MGGQKVEIITANESTLWIGAGVEGVFHWCPAFFYRSSPFSIISVRQLPRSTITCRYYCYIFKVENFGASPKKPKNVIMIRILELN